MTRRRCDVWSLRELKVLHEVYPEYGTEAVAARIGRTKAAVNNRVRIEGIKRAFEKIPPDANQARHPLSARDKARLMDPTLLEPCIECTHCKQVKPAPSFYHMTGGVGGRATVCKSCVNDRARIKNKTRNRQRRWET